MLADPASTGMVHRAILQSGSGTAAFTPEQAGKVTAAVGRELGLVPTVRALADVSDERHATAAKFHPRPDEFVRIHQAGNLGASAAESRVTILSDGLFGAGTLRMTESHARVAPTYAYSFAWRSNALAGQLGASHVMELPFVFDRLDLMSLRGPNALLGTGELPKDLATAMHAAWIRFAATGDPGWPGHPHIQQLGVSEGTGASTNPPYAMQAARWTADSTSMADTSPAP